MALLRCLAAIFLMQRAWGTDAEVSFSRQIAPVLQSKCAGCHNAEKAKGGYRVHSYEALVKAGKSKEPPLVPGKPAESELFKRLTTADLDDRMPQKDEALASEQIELFRQWIAAGATLDQGIPSAPLTSLIPKPPHPVPPEKYRRPLPILTVAFTPDGQRIATSGHHEVIFWSPTGELTQRLTNVPQRVRSLAFHPAGKLIAVAGGQPGRSGELSLYNLESAARETNLLQTADEILCVAFSADGQRLACAGTDNAIHVFDGEKRARISTIQQHADWITSLCFNTNGTLIASVSRDRTARIYDAVTGNLETTYNNQSAPLGVVAFLPDGNIVSGGRDKALHIWEPREGKKKSEIGGFPSDALALVSTGENLFTAGADGSIRQHSLPDRKLVRTLASQGDAVYALAYDSGSRMLASGSYNGTVNLWDTRDGTLARSFIAAPGWSSIR